MKHFLKLSLLVTAAALMGSRLLSPVILLSLAMMGIIAAIIAGGLYAARRRGHL